MFLVKGTQTATTRVCNIFYMWCINAAVMLFRGSREQKTSSASQSTEEIIRPPPTHTKTFLLRSHWQSSKHNHTSCSQSSDTPELRYTRAQTVSSTIKKLMTENESIIKNNKPDLVSDWTSLRNFYCFQTINWLLKNISASLIDTNW